MSAPRKRTRAPGRPRGAAPLNQQDLARAAGLKGFREQTGLTQVAFAKELGVSQTQLSQYEAAKVAIPDDVFQSLLELARSHAAAGDGGKAAEAAAPGEEGSPLPGPEPFVPPAAGDTPPFIPNLDTSTTDALGGIAGAMSGELSAAQKQMAADLEGFYQLLAMAVSRFSQGAGAVLYTDSGQLAQSAVLAAEEAAWLKRAIALLSAGPLFGFFLLHGLTAMKIEQVIRAERAEKRAALERARLSATAPAQPAPPSAHEAVDPLDAYRQRGDTVANAA